MTILDQVKIIQNKANKYDKLKKIIPRIVKSIKMLRKKINTLTAKNKHLRQTNKMLKNDIITLQHELAELNRDYIEADGYWYIAIFDNNRLRQENRYLMARNEDLEYALNLNSAGFLSQMKFDGNIIQHPNLQLKIEMMRVRKKLNVALGKC